MVRNHKAKEQRESVCYIPTRVLEKVGTRDVDKLSDVDHVVRNAGSTQCEAQLYFFEDNKAVIKMIISNVEARWWDTYHELTGLR